MTVNCHLCNFCSNNLVTDGSVIEFLQLFQNLKNVKKLLLGV